MNKFVKIGIEETARKLGLEPSVVSHVVISYFSGIYLTLIRGGRDIKIDLFGTIKRNSKYEFFRSKFKFGNNNSTRGTPD